MENNSRLARKLLKSLKVAESEAIAQCTPTLLDKQGLWVMLPVSKVVISVTSARPPKSTRYQ